MQTKTYTRRENAKRAAIAAGIPAEQVQLIVQKDGDDVRFGWKRKTEADSKAHGPSMATANTPQTTTAKKRPVAPAAAAQREERNGIKRPRAGSRCAVVWSYLDEHGDTIAKDMRAIAETQNWNLNNSLIELYQWRRFNGVSKQVRKRTFRPQ